MNPFGIHFIPVHQGQQHYDFVRATRPGVMKLVSGNQAPDVQMMATMYERAPAALHVYRNVPLSEQHNDLWADPVGTAQRHVANWDAELRERRTEAARRGLLLPPKEQTMTLGVNEPIIELFAREENMSNYGEWLAMMKNRTPLLDDYMATYVAESRKLGQPCGVGNFSGGQPANLKPGGYATYDWFPKTLVALEANRGFASLVVHEYWDIPGPGEMTDWWTYRFFHCDWDADIYVLECGVDRGIRGPKWDGNRGWFGHMMPQQYADQNGEYIRHCRQDPRFKGATTFTLDGDEMWWSFWVDNCMAEMVALSDQLQREIQPGSTPPSTIHMPVVVVGQPITPGAPIPPNNTNNTPDSTPPAPLAGVLDPTVLQAILDIESGAAFGPSGRLIVRFEAHIFKAQLGNDELFNRYFQIADVQPWARPQYYRPQADGPWIQVHGAGQASEWAAFETAARLDSNAAYRSISMGRAQIMGFNYARVGYPSAEAMFKAFARREDGEAAQIVAFLNYLLSDAALVRAVKERDWRTIADKYNGSGAVDRYSGLLEAAWRKRAAG